MGGGDKNKEDGGAESGTPAPPSLDLVALSEYDKVPLSRVEVTVMAKIKAVSQDNEERRAPITICAAIDRSGSMKDHLGLLKETLSFVVQQLRSEDKLSLVTFDHEVCVDLPLTKMDAAGKLSAEKAIKAVKERGHTNLSGGLLAALEALYRVPNEEATIVESVLLFTDGKANVGMKNQAQLVRATSSMLTQIGRQPCVFTFGFGQEHDAALLQAVATAGNGLFYYIDNADSIPQSFGDCLGGLLSVAAQNVHLTFTAEQNTTLSQPLTSFKTVQKEPGKVFEVTIPDVYCEEEKCLLVTVTVPGDPKVTEPVNLPLLSCKVEFFDVLNAKQTESTYNCCIVRNNLCTHPISSDFAEEIELHKLRCVVADSLDDANKMANAGKFDGARDLLHRTTRRVKGSIAFSKPLAVHLLETLTESLAGLQDKVTYVEHGQSTIMNYVGSHWQQRSNMKPSSIGYLKQKKFSSEASRTASSSSQAQVSGASASALAEEEEETFSPYTVTSKLKMIRKAKKK